MQWTSSWKCSWINWNSNYYMWQGILIHGNNILFWIISILFWFIYMNYQNIFCQCAASGNGSRMNPRNNDQKCFGEIPVTYVRTYVRIQFFWRGGQDQDRQIVLGFKSSHVCKYVAMHVSIYIRMCVRTYDLLSRSNGLLWFS